MGNEKNTLTLGLIGASPFANAEFLLKSRPDFGEEPLSLQMDADLTHGKNFSETAQGQILYVKGIVRGEDLRPVSGAWVEIWQTNRFGQYHHYNRKETFLLDPNFRGWGRCLTGPAGEYLFKTVLPGEYTGKSQMVEPRQIHFSIRFFGKDPYKTRMYFSRHHDLTKGDKAPLKGTRENIMNLYRPSLNSSFGPESYVVYFPILISPPLQ